MLRWCLELFSNKVFLIKVCTFFRHNVIAHLVYYIVIITFMHLETKLTLLQYLPIAVICNTSLWGVPVHFIVWWFSFFLWSICQEHPLKVKRMGYRWRRSWKLKERGEVIEFYISLVKCFHETFLLIQIDFSPRD